MSFNARLNALDQLLDIQGSSRQEATRTLLDESSQFGHVVVGQSGSTASIIASSSAGTMRVSGTSTWTTADLTNYLTITGALTASNNGTFAIITIVSASIVDVANNNGALSPDGNNNTITYTERSPYSLEDDLNFARTDRTLIKGVNFDQAIPTYQRPSAIGTNVAANLANIAGKTTDAMGFVQNKQYYSFSGSAAPGLTLSGSLSGNLTSVGNLKFSDAVDKRGIPVFDSGPFANDFKACFVAISDPVHDNELVVLSGSLKDQKIFGLTYSGSAVTPNSVEIRYFSSPAGVDPSIGANRTAYSWEAGQPLTASLTVGYFDLLSNLDVDSFRKIEVMGIQSDGDLRQDVTNLESVIGSVDGAVSLATLLTNTGTNFEFSALSATPTVVSALNALNSGTGDRSYTGPYLSNAQAVATSLQALSNAIVAITGATVTRYITRLTGTVPAGVAIPVPAAFVLDGTNGGKGMMVFSRGILRDPGPASSNNDYSETTTGSVTFYSKNKNGDHINWLIL